MTHSSFKTQATVENISHNFLDNLSTQPDISQLLKDNYKQHQATLIQHDLDHIEHNEPLINQLLNHNSLTISTHNTRNISDIFKYTQLLETLTMNKVDFCSVTEIRHMKSQPYKHKHHPNYTVLWSTTINRYAGVGLILHHK